MTLFAFEIDRINDGIRALGGFDCGEQRLLAAAIDAVGENYKRLAARLLLHQLIGGEIDRVIQHRSPATDAMTSAAGVLWIAGIAELRRSELIDGCAQLVLVRSHVGEQIDFAVELDQEGFIAGVGHHLVEKMLAGRALGIENVALAHAGVDEQPERKGEIGVPVEVLDGLRTTILGEREVILGEVGNDGSMLVAHGDGHGHYFDIYIAVWSPEPAGFEQTTGWRIEAQ